MVRIRTYWKVSLTYLSVNHVLEGILDTVKTILPDVNGNRLDLARRKQLRRKLGVLACVA